MPEIGESRKNGSLLKTGQLTQYAGYLDDGYYQKGLSKKYTILTTGSRAGTTNITLNGKTDFHSNNCVYDQRTKLMWSRYASASVGPTSDGKLPFTTNGDGEGIFPYVQAANNALLSGYNDWRIPNCFEFLSLMDFEPPIASPDVTAFPDMLAAAWYATSTVNPAGTTQNKTANFQLGSLDNDNKTSSRYTLLVRGGK